MNVARSLQVAEECLEAGFIPFVPLLSHYWHAVHPKKPEEWYVYDLEWVKRCDYMIRLPGPSVGADKEVALAHKMNIPVYASVADLEGALGYGAT